MAASPLSRPIAAALAGTVALVLTAGACSPTAPTRADAAGPPAASASSAAGPDAAACEPVEARPPNGRDQRPAFAGQTRACAAPSGVAFTVDVVATGLVHPWAVRPLPDGRLLVTERPGRLRIVTAAGAVGAPIAGLPAVDARGQGGLLDVALSPTFAADRRVYWSYAEPRPGGNGTAVARGTLSADERRVDAVEVLFRVQPTYDGDKHFGSRLAFGPDGMLYITLGERSDTPMRPQAQSLASHLGKTIRIAPDGSVPPDNPFAGRAGALPEIWSTGHRNVQAAAFDAAGRLWEVEMGTRGGDELNLVRRGANYGWPVAAYGVEYSGAPIAGAETAREGTEQPAYYWDPVIAPSGAAWYGGEAFPPWRGSLFVGALGQRRLVRLTVEGDRVTGEEHLLAERGKRIRDVREGPDGALYVVTDEDAGELWRIRP